MIRNKMTSTVVTGASQSQQSRLRTKSKFLRVISDRAMMISRISQQQTEKTRQRNEYTTQQSQTQRSTLIYATQTSLPSAVRLQPQQQQQQPSPEAFTSSQSVISSTYDPSSAMSTMPTSYSIDALCELASPMKLLPEDEDSQFKTPSKKVSLDVKSSPFAPKVTPLVSKMNMNKICLQPIKTTHLKDKQNLLQHIKGLYADVNVTGGSVVFAAQSIVSSISHYVELNGLDLKETVNEILTEHIFQSNLELKKRYHILGDVLCDAFKTEGQLQILLQIENYIIANSVANSTKVRVDDDAVWDIANAMRWMSQHFRDKFKIERFVYGEVFTYNTSAPDFVQSLMEELGLEKQQQEKNTLKENSSSSSLNCSARSSPGVSPSFLPVEKRPSGGLPSRFESAADSQTADSPSKIFTFTGGVSRLFSEFNEYTNDGESLLDNDDLRGTQTADDDLSIDLKKRKSIGATRFSDFSMTASRSIVVQKKKMRLKIRSPYKSPSKTSRHMVVAASTSGSSRKSPRIRKTPVLENNVSSSGRKRSRPCLITDTPDHKQNATRITSRQEKVRKSFSFAPHAQLPMVPETPAKEPRTPVVLTTPVKVENRCLTVITNSSATKQHSPRKAHFR